MFKTIIFIAILPVFVVILFFVLQFTNDCSVNPSELTNDYAKSFADNIKYVQDKRTGLCFGFIVASRKTGSLNSTALGMTNVPCEKVEHLLVK